MSSKKSIIRRLLAKFVRYVLILSLLSCCISGFLYWKWVIHDPGEHMQKESIIQVISQDSQIHYKGFDPTSDQNENPIGSMFSGHHRQYIPYEDLPEDWINAIVSSEDHLFFTHHGISPFGIARAAKNNFLAGRVVSGGSTLTQQTAKNLFNRPDRSFRAKVNEAINALRLEHYYSKEQILEFYANQFHVNGNGRGIAIAARYFFNKSVSELSLVECAFIAGMVKGPNLYDPLHQRSAERREKANNRAHDRVSYVLRRMRELEKITEEEYQKAMQVVEQKQIPFSRGRFRFENNVITQEVKRRLNSASFQKILRNIGVEDPSSAGLHIVTTIDKEVQKRALYGFRTHLSELGPKLKGTKKTIVVDASKYIERAMEHPPQAFSFHFAKVVQRSKKTLKLDIRGHSCTAGSKELWHTAKAYGVKVSQVLRSVKVGDIVRVRFDEKQSCFIMVNHELDGGLLAVQNGGIVAMVGGQTNRDLNRALSSERQLGSVWKTLIYNAALHLGWSSLDMLDNVHNAFYFERIWYFPKSAHKANDFVSMNWAGTHSENKASVWLMMHLSDLLTVSQLEELAEIVGLTQQEEETEQEYRIRIRDRYGVISTHKNLEQIAFAHAKREVLSKVEDDIRTPLMSLEYGGEKTEKRLRMRNKGEEVGLEHTWTRIQQRKSDCDDAYQSLKDFVSNQNHFHYDFFQLSAKEPNDLDPKVKEKLWMGDGFIGCGFTHQAQEPLPLLETWKKIPPLRYDGYIPASVVSEIMHKMKKYMVLYREIDGYSIKRLIHHEDFRYVLHARYISMLVQKMGVKKDLDIAMSIPLGVVDITLEESLALYEGILTGQRSVSDHEFLYRLIDKIYYTPHPFEEGNGDPILLYSASKQSVEVSHQRSGDRTLAILHNVVENGTGKKIRGGIKGFPVFGKTGTTNGSKNAAFCGVVPTTENGKWSFRNGLFVSAYVGFDTPKSMKRGRYGVSGASGALPIWSFAVEGAIDAGLLGESPNYDSWISERNLTKVQIEENQGSVSSEGTKFAIEDYNEGKVLRYYSPIRSEGNQQEDLMDFDAEFAYDEEIDILIPKEN